MIRNSIPNANEIMYTCFEIFGEKAIFTCGQIDRETVPVGLYAYDIYENEVGIFIEICENSPVHHSDDGTVITKKPIICGQGVYHRYNGAACKRVTRHDYCFYDKRILLQQFICSDNQSHA